MRHPLTTLALMFWALILLTLVTGVLIALNSAPAAAQTSPNCFPRAVLADLLTDRYGETVVGSGVDPQGNLFEMWGNTETGTWSIVGSAADGTSCLLTSGESYEFQPGLPNTDPAL